ncbi:hypothetical protein EJ03DRAFT_116091 [Teratosphaeria nubilosa]|uniref:Uncharacterized protein n=1 Tax=Teratosphaeria nubilosa TaxID=161662 RepID=A0A6G1L6T8_9PEZI|nr:hypothetical protein EJ03DRAFT_116091 [Teratosphaeria nubilosa]
MLLGHLTGQCLLASRSLLTIKSNVEKWRSGSRMSLLGNGTPLHFCAFQPSPVAPATAVRHLLASMVAGPQKWAREVGKPQIAVPSTRYRISLMLNPAGTGFLQDMDPASLLLRPLYTWILQSQDGIRGSCGHCPRQ